MGRIITNIQVFNVFRKRFERKQVKIENGVFTEVESVCSVTNDDEIIDGKGVKMIPGLIDIHMHIESSMSVPNRFDEQALRYGVTTVVADPHEIANVFGVEGIHAFLACETIMDIYYGIPSSVPSTRSDMETTGGVITTKEVETLLQDHRFRCLGEVMNFNDLIANEETEIKKIIALCRKKNPWMPIEGHCPRISGSALSKFISAGVDSDHTQQTPESIQEKFEKGMFLEIQRKSLSKDTVTKINELQAYEQLCLITDDVMCDHLLEGHLNLIMKQAVALGMPEEMAIYCSTYTPARRMGFFDRGAIAPGRIADFVFIDDDFNIIDVCKKGRFIKEISFDTNQIDFQKYKQSIHRKALQINDFDIPYATDGVVKVNVMQLEPHSNFTKWVIREVPVIDQKLAWWKTDLSLLTCIERYGKTNNIAFGLVENGIGEGAVCSSWAHDHHNLMAMGKNVEDMMIGLNHLIAIQGGYCVVNQSEVVACLELPIGGIVSDAPIQDMANQLGQVREAMHKQGYVHNNVIMSFATLSLPVSPELKLTDQGLIDTKSLRKIKLIEE